MYTSILLSTTQHYKPNYSVGLTTLQQNLPFSLIAVLLSHKTPNSLFHFIQPYLISCFISTIKLSNLCAKNFKYLNLKFIYHVTAFCRSSFRSTIGASSNSYSIYSILLIFNPFPSRTSIYSSSLLLFSSKILSSANIIHYSILHTVPPK